MNASKQIHGIPTPLETRTRRRVHHGASFVTMQEREKDLKKGRGRKIEERIIFGASSEDEAHKWVHLIQWLIK